MARIPTMPVSNRRPALVQSGVSTKNGNALVPNAGFKVSKVVMPVQPRNKPWVPAWHPLHPSNNR